MSVREVQGGFFLTPQMKTRGMGQREETFFTEFKYQCPEISRVFLNNEGESIWGMNGYSSHLDVEIRKKKVKHPHKAHCDTCQFEWAS